MRAFFARMNPTLRGFLIILAICVVVVVLQLQNTLVALTIIARVAFILAIAVFVFLVWRERRSEIGEWPRRASLAPPA
jgi:small-conductance mechanosensitive channel